MGNFMCCDKEESVKRSSSNKSHRSSRERRTDSANVRRRPTVRSVQETMAVTPSATEQFPVDLTRSEERTISKHGPENYQSLKYLGRGTFGDVVLAEDKETSKQYAMKIIDKSKIKEVNLMQCKNIKNISHRDVLVTIRETFQNENKIYIIMEYLNKGDIYFYLKKKEVIFTENVIKGLLSEIIFGLELLHSYGIIYRELKPENILVTNEGHIKLTDYGLSKMLIENKTSTCTFVGTLEYMAPEAIKGNYGMEVDLWSIGILMFELKFECNPFSNLEHTELAIQNSILTSNIEDVLNENIGKVSQELRDLLIGLLQKNPKERLTIPQVKEHPFFNGIDWEEVSNRKNIPPLKEFIEKNDHIRFRDPTNEAEVSHRFIKCMGREGKDDYKAELFEFCRNST